MGTHAVGVHCLAYIETSSDRPALIYFEDSDQNCWGHYQLIADQLPIDLRFSKWYICALCATPLGAKAEG